MRVTYLSLAVWDLAEIRSYIAANDSDTAQQVGKRLTQIINRLSALPNLGKPGRVFGTRELITPKIGKTAYIIVYRVKSERIEILRVLPGMQDINRILDEEEPEEQN
jgi:toxin ParE1/3/4